MQDNRRDHAGEELKNNQNTASGIFQNNGNNTVQQIGQQQSTQDKQSTLEPSEIDQQEGNMNNGTVGGNFREDDTDKTYEHFSPPY
jgi:hypothetical protein